MSRHPRPHSARGYRKHLWALVAGGNRRSDPHHRPRHLADSGPL